MVASGASPHLVSNKHLTEAERKLIKPLATPIKLQTANGVVTCRKHVVIYVQELELELIALVMGDAPPVLSLGRLCTETT